jgi:hypothetical protein
VRWYAFHSHIPHNSDHFPENRPICRRCARNNSPCGYGIRLIWNEESVARGVCHGRAGVWSKRSNVEHGGSKDTARQDNGIEDRQTSRLEQTDRSNPVWMFLNTTTTDLEIHLDGARPKATGSDIPRSDPLSPSLSTIPAKGRRSDYDPALMSYFEHTICSSSTLVDNAHYNPYRYLILPMALQSEGLYHATLAIAANTLGLSNPKYRLPALEHHNRALGHLRGLLTHDTWGEKELDEMLGLVLMLCWFDVRCRASLSDRNRTHRPNRFQITAVRHG